MADKNKVDKSLSEYSEFFKDVIQVYDDMLGKSRKYLKTSDDKIDALAAYDVTTRGSQHYLAEHMTNAVSLISQCQSLADSKFKVKKTILDLAIKDANADDSESSDLTALVNELIEMQKRDRKENEDAIKDFEASTAELDDEIEKILQAQKESD